MALFLARWRLVVDLEWIYVTRLVIFGDGIEG